MLYADDADRICTHRSLWHTTIYLKTHAWRLQEISHAELGTCVLKRTLFCKRHYPSNVSFVAAIHTAHTEAADF